MVFNFRSTIGSRLKYALPIRILGVIDGVFTIASLTLIDLALSEKYLMRQMDRYAEKYTEEQNVFGKIDLQAIADELFAAKLTVVDFSQPIEIDNTVETPLTLVKDKENSAPSRIGYGDCC